MSIEVNCQSCGRILYVPAEFAGAAIKCLGCEAPVRVPRRNSSLGEKPAELACPKCQAVLRVTAKLAGKRVSCNTCRSPLAVMPDPLHVISIDANRLMRLGGERTQNERHFSEYNDEVRSRGHLHASTSELSTENKSHEGGSALRGRKVSHSTSRVADEPEPSSVKQTSQRSPSNTAFSGSRNGTRKEPQHKQDNRHQNTTSKKTQGKLSRKTPLIVGATVACMVVIAFTSLWRGNAGIQRRAITGRIAGASGRNGEIKFIPMGVPERPSATTNIRNGEYAFDRSNGPASGLYRVHIKFDQGSREPENAPIPIVVPEEGPWELDIGMSP